MEKVIITICASKDSFGAYSENCEGIYAAGDTVADFKAAYERIKQEYTQKGKHFVEVEFNFTYDVA